MSENTKTAKTTVLLLMGAIATVWVGVFGAQWLFDISHGANWGLATLLSVALTIMAIWLKVIFKVSGL